MILLIDRLEDTIELNNLDFLKYVDRQRTNRSLAEWFFHLPAMIFTPWLQSPYSI